MAAKRACRRGGNITPPGTEAKLITKSQSLERLPRRITTAEYTDGICTADDCWNVMPQLVAEIFEAELSRGFFKINLAFLFVNHC